MFIIFKLLDAEVKRYKISTSDANTDAPTQLNYDLALCSIKNMFHKGIYTLKKVRTNRPNLLH